MAKEYAKEFYNSTAWRKTKEAYAASVFYLCERCGKEGYICHHINHITPKNINNPDITLSWSNLMYLCQECHNSIHGTQGNRIPRFDDEGNMIGLVE